MEPLVVRAEAGNWDRLIEAVEAYLDAAPAAAWVVLYDEHARLAACIGNSAAVLPGARPVARVQRRQHEGAAV